MRGERESDPEALMARYGVGRRLATRVVALLSKNLDVTPTILEEAGSDEALAKLLLDRRLLKEPREVTEADLQERAQGLGWDEADLLRLVSGPDTWRTIALEDDVLAETAREQEPPSGGEELGLVRAVPGEISATETHDLFAPEEVAHLKLTALTSQNPEERVEALRKLVFAPMDGSQKARIFVNVLTERDADLKVRREAIRSLEQIGFRADMADAVRDLFSEDTEEAVYAIRRLDKLLDEAEEGEAALSLAVLLEVLDQNRDEEIIRELLQLAESSASLLVTNYEKTERFVQSAVRHLTRDFDAVRPQVEDAFAACAGAALELTVDLLWTEMQRTDSPRVRSLLLSLCETASSDGPRTQELAERAVAEILNPEVPEAEKARLRYALLRIGEPAAREVLGRVTTASEVQKSELIRILDVVCTEGEVSDQTVEETIRTLLDLLKLADKVTRRNVVQAAILTDERVPTELRTELARELLALMEELSLPDALDVVQNALQQIGPAVLEPVYDFMRRTYPSEPAERAALVLDRIIEDRPASLGADLAKRLYDTCSELLGRENLERGAFTMPLGAVCGYTDWGADVFNDTLRRLREQLWQVPYSMDVLEAMAVMAGAPNAGTEQQQEMFDLFDGIVRFQARTGLGKRRESEEGTLYEFGREIQFDIRAVPAAVRGLESICVSEQASDEMRRDIVKRLLVLWEGVSRVRVIWGPAAIEALINAMCGAACCPETSMVMKQRLAVSLRRSLNKLRVIEALGQICSRPDPQVEDLAVETADEMLDEWQETDVEDDERRLALLQSVGRIAANPALDPDRDEVERVRERAAQALFSGLREGMHRVRDALVLLRDCPDTPPARRREIDDRLTKALGLVPKRR